MKRTTVSHLVNQDTKTVVGIKVKTSDDEFVIPVVSVLSDRITANNMIKQSKVNRGSKFLHPSYSVMGRSYQVSYKK